MNDLEHRLVAVAEQIPIAAAERFRDDVLARIATPQRPRRKLIVLVAVGLVTGSLGAVPGTRGAFARWLGFDSVRIEPGPFSTAPPSVTSPMAGAAPPVSAPPHQGLGPAVSVEEAERAWGRPVRLPGGFGDPASLHVVDRVGVVQVVAVYPPGPDLPTVGALVTLFAAQLDTAYFVKFVGADTTVETLAIDGDPAIWLEGEPHQVAISVNGEVVVDSLRLATNTLLRQHGDVVLRIEADISRTEAVGLARTWEPPVG